MKKIWISFGSRMRLKGRKYKLKELSAKLEVFRNAFDDFTLLRSKELSVNIRSGTADVEIDLKFLGILEGSGNEEIFAGKAKFHLKNQYDYWCISALELPGFDF